jgi:nitrogen regulatory protein PII
MDIDIVLKPGDLWKVREKLLELGFNETSGSHLEKKGLHAVDGFNTMWGHEQK